MVDRARHGEDITITSNGVSVAKLEALPRPALAVGELIERRRHLPHVDAQKWRADVDSVIDPSL